MAKKIIICCDGTGNEIKENQSNVLKFFRTLVKDRNQVAYYDPGVGTICDTNAWAKFKHKAKGVFGLATGYGLDENVLDAYHFLIDNYQPGDKIYLFGFSRGAYTVRVLAGFLNLVGLISAEQRNMSSYALTAYKQANEDDSGSIATRFHDVMETQKVGVQFMGCWDTVGSVIVPRPDRFYVPALEVLPHTQRNPCVKVFRHALAIDECRRMFRIAQWDDPQPYRSSSTETQHKDQDIKQVWFSGVHSDIGGGYKEQESGAAKIPLKWMVTESENYGVLFDKEKVRRLVDGDNNDSKSTRTYVQPDSTAELHDSMNFGWVILEFLPKNVKYRVWPNRKVVFGRYLPRREPRFIPDQALVDSSVYDRLEKTRSNNKPYMPKNLRDSIKATQLKQVSGVDTDFQN